MRRSLSPGGPSRPLNGERRLRTDFTRPFPFLRAVLPAAALFLAATGIARAVAFSPDGRFALTASSDEVVRMWHLRSDDRIGISSAEVTSPKPWLTSTHPGARMFRKRALCHSLTADGPKRSGPHFAGLFGRRAGSVNGYRYSDALAGLDLESGTIKPCAPFSIKGRTFSCPAPKCPCSKFRTRNN